MDESLKKIKKAIEISEKAFQEIIQEHLKIGMSEIEVSDLLTQKLKEYGATELAFPTILVSGIRGCLPHGLPSQKIIEAGDFITIDFGAKYEGYCADITRTIVMKPVTNRKLKKIYDVVKKANKIAIESIREGITCYELDLIVRNYITSQGFGEYYIHPLGHGVGSGVHEPPFIHKKSMEVLKKGMILAIEPGIYIRGVGGVRIEDVVLVLEKSGKVLTSYSKELIEV